MRLMLMVLLATVPAVASCGGVDCDECEEITRAIQAEVEANRGRPIDQGGLSGSQTPCGPVDDPSADVPYYADACDELRDCLGGDPDACD